MYVSPGAPVLHDGVMSTGDDPSVRVGNDERQAAIAALGEQWKAGRLDPAEHERRTTAAYSATTRGDLDALFTDLPGGRSPAMSTAQDAPTGATSGLAVTPGTAVGQPTAAGGSVSSVSPVARGGMFPPDSWAAQHRDAIMGVTPFVALALFFLTKEWIFFLLVPVLGVVLYAGDGDGSRRRGRDDRDERRRIERGE